MKRRTGSISGRAAGWLALVLSACGSPAGPRASTPATAPQEPRPPVPAKAIVPVPSSSAGSLPIEPTIGPPGPDAEWGTPHPLIVAGASRSGTWVALCQARADTNGDGKISVGVGEQGELEGDRLEGFLLTEPGAGSRIDSYAGADPTGRFVAFVRDERLFLLDTTTRALSDLSASGADVRDDQSHYRNHRAVAFDPTGRFMLYFRTAADGAQLSVRELLTGNERVLSTGTGVVWRAEFDASGERIFLKVITTDTNGNGRLEWLVHPSRRQYMRCPPPVPRYPVWEYPGDRPMTRILRVDGGELTDAPELVVPLTRGYVEREANGALWLREYGGQRVLLRRDKCQARVLHADFRRELVIANCPKKGGRYSISLLYRGSVIDLPLEMATAGADHWYPDSPRLVPLQAGAESALFDMEARTLEKLQPMDRVVATHERVALVLRGDSLVVHPFGEGETKLDRNISPTIHVLREGGYVYVSPVLVDMQARAVVAHVEARPLSLSNDGRLLMPAEDADATRLATGPLRWTPAPEPKPGPTE